MSRSAFFARTSSLDQRPLLPEHTQSISLQNLSPQGESSRSSEASSSPPPSFYRSRNNHLFETSRAYSPSPSPSRSNASPSNRKIQFAAPPPPITSSVFLRAPSRPTSSSNVQLSERRRILRVSPGAPDPLVVLERRERAIQQELQLLLDAQSTGLGHGVGGGDAASDAGNSDTTPTMRSRGSSSGKKKGSVVPVRQPKRKPISLKGARRGLGRDMEELVHVKDEEVVILDAEVERREEVLRKVAHWEKRMEKVRRELSGYSGIGKQELGGGENAMEIAELQSEENAVKNEIRECEERLAQMRARQSWLQSRIKEGVNRQESHLSSYKGALKEVESEVLEFLKRPPVERSIVMPPSEQAFTSLPVHRRTLIMASEWWSREITQLQLRKAEVVMERQALEEGARMWGDCVDVVGAFEDDLRHQMRQGEVQGEEGLERQVEKMQMVIERLSASSKQAEERGWNLLICAVGAELAAFEEGKTILKGALAVASDRNGLGEEEGSREESFHSFEDGNRADELRGLNLDGREQNLSLSGGQEVVSKERSESEDDSDGPNLAELLVDRGSRGSFRS